MSESRISGNLYQNSRGSYYYERTTNGNLYRVSLNTKEFNEAVSKKDVLNDLFDLVIYPENSKQTDSPSFYQVCNHWLDRKRKTCLKSTIKSYQYALRKHLLNAPFAEKAIDTIKRDEIDQWCQSFRNSINNNSFNKILNILSNVFDFARKMGLVETNPVKMIDRPKPIVNMPKPFTDEEVDILLNNIDPFYRDYQGMLFFLFLRPSEINSLKPSDIDLANKVIWIRNRKYIKSEKIIPIPMDDRVSNIISRQLELAKKHSSKTLFFNKNGKPIHSAYYRRMVWKPLLEKTKIMEAGMQYRPIRDCRYTYISNLHNHGQVSINVLKQLQPFFLKLHRSC